MSGGLEALLLDAMGTLLELREPAAQVYVKVAARHGLPRELGEVSRALATTRIAPPALDAVALADVPAREREGWRGVVRAALGEAAAAGPCFDELFAEFAKPRAWRLVNGAQQALGVARAVGMRCAVVSNMDARLPGLLAGLGVSDDLDALVLPSTCGFAKPDPRIFAYALTRLGVSADRALYVGDREPDCVQAARAAGLHAWRLDPGAAPGTADVLRGWAELEPRLLGFARARRSG